MANESVVRSVASEAVRYLGHLRAFEGSPRCRPSRRHRRRTCRFPGRRLGLAAVEIIRWKRPDARRSFTTMNASSRRRRTFSVSFGYPAPFQAGRDTGSLRRVYASVGAEAALPPPANSRHHRSGHPCRHGTAPCPLIDERVKPDAGKLDDRLELRLLARAWWTPSPSSAPVKTGPNTVEPSGAG